MHANVTPTASPDLPSARLRILCSCPAHGFEAFARRLRACAAEHDQVELRWFEHAASLARYTRFAAVVSATQPSLVVLRGATVVCNAIGDLPGFELRSLVRRAAEGRR